jgi:hypothetical protein
MGGLDAEGDDPPLSGDRGARWQASRNSSALRTTWSAASEHKGVAIGGESCYVTNLNPTTAK